MKKAISLLILAIFATSANGSVMFSDDFESGSLDQWIIGGRQRDGHGGINIAEVVYRNSSQMAHIHHSLDTTEITLEKLLDYRPNLIFNFDIEVSVSSIAGPTDDDYAMGGAFFDFLDSSGELIGFVRYICSTSSYPFTIYNSSPSREYIALPDSSLHSYSFTLEDILSHITVDTDSIAYINFSFWAYNSGWGWNMSADVWVDNVVVSVPELVGLEIAGPGEVAENFSASYKAIAYYDDDSTRDVTDSAEWVVEPNTAANIDENGVLTTKDVVTHRSATILAGYSEGDVTVEAEKAIDILAICPTGTALQFDGEDDYVSVPDDASLNITGDITISAWVYFTQGGSYQAIVTKCVGAGGRNNPFDFRTDTSAEPRLALVRADAMGHERVYSNKAISLNNWHHVLVRMENQVPDFYVDGVVTGKWPNATFTRTPTGNTNPLLIGRRGYGLHFNGTIDEVAIYNRALSGEEIVANMHTRLAGDEPNLVGYWDFDEGEGQIVYDLSGNGNDGYLGVDPCAVDAGDPAWIESDAPIGICSLYQIATLATDGAVERKTSLIEELLAGLTGEWTAYQALEEWLESGDYGDLNYGDIVTAKQKIHSAMQHEEQSIGALDKSVEKLKDALSSLGYEPGPAANIDENDVLTTKILASYTEGEVTVDAEKAIDVLAICPTGAALQFDGVNDYVRTLNDIFSNAQLASGATLSAWFQTDSTDHSYIADNEGYLTLGINHIYAPNPNKLVGIVDGGYHRFFSSSDVTDNLWHHAAIVWDGTDTAILYLDGVNVSSGRSGPPTPDRKTRPFTIGAHSTIAAYFNGTIDDVRVYNRALSAEEIVANMHTRLAGDELGLVGYWDFDEGGGQIVYDLSGSGNDGQLGSTPNPDVSDPAWVDSDAPIGMCSLYQIAILAVDGAVERKTALLEELLAALTEEWAAYEALEELLKSGDYGDLNKGDIVTAKQKIHSAIQHEEQSIDALEKSIEKLEDALSALGYDPAGQASNPNPANGATNVSTSTDLSWTAGSNAVSHDVYFGTRSPPPFISNQTAATFEPGTMAEDTTYYWRIDEVNPSWTTTGTVWSFTTGGGGWPPV